MTDENRKSNPDAARRIRWKSLLISLLAFVVAFVAVKALRQESADRDAIARGAAKAEQSMRDLQAQAANEHPDKPLGEARQIASTEVSQAELSRKSGQAKADAAAGQFLGYYLVNVRARADYCKAQGIDIGPFVDAFKRQNAAFYAKSRAIHARGPVSPDDLETKFYEQLRPSLESTIQDNTTDFAARNNMTVAEVCQGLADKPEESAKLLDLAHLNPALYDALSNAD
ncbi:hypothetical protein LJR296_008005 [Cupriavidus necator]|uniref:hypothetical protein n=1 Tax=Cupriavidus necator TaxID=106590 RepID=UPI003ECE654F